MSLFLLNTSDLDFGQCWNFCGAIIEVRTDKSPYKEVTRTRSDKGVVSSLDYILKIIIFEEILVLQNAPKWGGGYFQK